MSGEDAAILTGMIEIGPLLLPLRDNMIAKRRGDFLKLEDGWNQDSTFKQESKLSKHRYRAEPSFSFLLLGIHTTN